MARGTGPPDEPAGSNGTIHDCYDSEGGCAETVINEQGTIMSYCHLQPAGAILEFHPVVEQAALFPTINANGFCHGNCAAIETSCGSYGCTDPTACNYNPDAVQDDGCGVIDECGVCAGLGASCTGCTDPAACNYFEDAIFDDGSCTFPPAGFPCDCVTEVTAVADLAANASFSAQQEAIGTLTSVDITLVWRTRPATAVGPETCFWKSVPPTAPVWALADTMSEPDAPWRVGLALRLERLCFGHLHAFCGFGQLGHDRRRQLEHQPHQRLDQLGWGQLRHARRFQWSLLRRAHLRWLHRP